MMGNGIEKLVPAGLIVISLAIAVVMMLAILGGMSKVVRSSTDVDVAAITVPAVNATVSIGTTGQYPFLQDVTDCVNATSPGNDFTEYSVHEGTADGGTIKLLDDGSDWATGSINCSINYLADSSAQDVADKFVLGLGIFGLFIGVFVLSVVGMIIMTMFRGGKKGTEE